MPKLYSEDHEWVEETAEKGIYRVGISNHAQDALGDMVFVEVPEAGTEAAKGDTVGTIESVKAASDLYAPVSGTVTGVNPAIGDDPGIVNRDSEGDGWIYEARIGNVAELDDLMDAAAYAKFVA